VAAGLSRRTAPSFRGLGIGVWLALVVSIVIAGCGAGAPNVAPVTFPPRSFGPTGASTGAAATTRAVIAQALGVKRLQLRDAQIVVRPPESPRLVAAPRLVVQAVLPDDPTHGLISIYEFPDDSAAAEAGREEATYIASGPGRVQFTADARFVIRQLGPTIVFYTWSPGSTSDATNAAIQQALESIGIGVAVPS
jgi:hypothetical protein